MNIREQVKKLRRLAKAYRRRPYGREIMGAEEALSKAADTIEALTAKLAAVNMERSDMVNRNKLIEEIDKEINAVIVKDTYSKGKNAGLRKAKNLAEEQTDTNYGGGWIPCSERFPNKEEYLKDDGRFILDDGNRRYQGLFDIYDGKFKFSKHISGIKYELFEDRCVIAWQPLPEPYRKDGVN